MRIPFVIAVASLIISAPTLAVSGEKISKKSESGTIKSSIDQLQKACKSDLEKHCADVNPGEGRLAACLASKQDQLSDQCETAYLGTKARISRELDKTELALRKSCGNDVSKYCSDVPSGRGRILSCLQDNRDNLSDSCLAFEKSLDQRLSALMG